MANATKRNRQEEWVAPVRPEEESMNDKVYVKEEDAGWIEQSHGLPSFSQSFCDSFSFQSPSSHRIPKSESSSAKRREIPRTVTGHSQRRRKIKEKDVEECLPEVPDYVRCDMDILFIGSNPGRMSSQKGQHFSHPSNHFYRAIHRGGLTPMQVPPSEDHTMLAQASPFFSLGLTNLAARPTRLAEELNADENELGTEILVRLIRSNRPRLGIFVGIGVGRAFDQSVNKLTRSTRQDHELEFKREEDTAKASMATLCEDRGEQVTFDMPCEVPKVDEGEMGYGVGVMKFAIRHSVSTTGALQSGRLPYTILFATPSTSGRVTSHQLPQKAECMRQARILTEFLASSPEERANIATKKVVFTLI